VNLRLSEALDRFSMMFKKLNSVQTDEIKGRIENQVKLRQIFDEGITED
jgi:hypothetical protein